MPNEKNLCYRCKRFARYYYKSIRKFNQTKFGWCSVEQAIVKGDGGCEEYETQHKCSRSNRLLRISLNDLLTQISQLRAMIEEENNEADEVQNL